MATQQKKVEAPQDAESTRPQNLAAAIIQVMNEVKNIEKNLNVGDGKSSYKGVADKDVKQKVGEAMAKAGLAILPIDIEPTIKIERWVEETNYGPKTKQSVFTEVKTKYLLLHESGQTMEIVGYGHGVDSQDKSAGKATTYALKYALLYSFMVPTGTIDDADKEHSDSQTIKTIVAPTPQIKKRGLKNEDFIRACNAISNNEYSIDELLNEFQLTDSQLTDIEIFKTK